jgi:hypothetical protein
MPDAKAEPVVLDTVGKMADRGYRLGVHCENHSCRHVGIISYRDLEKTLGRDHSFFVKDKLVCSKCGGKALTVHHMPPTAPTKDGTD